MIKKIAFASLGVVSVAGAGLGLAAWQFEAPIYAGASIGEVQLGGLHEDEAKFALRAWWESIRTEPIEVRKDGFEVAPEGFFASKLGIEIDDEASIAQLPRDTFWGNLARLFLRESPEARTFQPRFRLNEDRVASLRKYVETYGEKPEPARIAWVNGRVQVMPERGGRVLDETQLLEVAEQAILFGAPISIPTRTPDRTYSDEQLSRLNTVLAEFTTRFNVGQANRSHNIRLAAEKINGMLLGPGERFSFNEVVGRRSAERGFRLAGIYVNGRHDVDIGGGICQVSTTLYNAAVKSNLVVRQRSCHSLPVPYVALGQDAAVSYGVLDLTFENPYEYPIGILSEISGGSITFRIVGDGNDKRDIRLVNQVVESWTHETKTVEDRSLPPGGRREIEKGGRGYRVVTYRVEYRNNREVSRERLSTSVYRGGPRIVAVNSTPAPARPSAGLSDYEPIAPMDLDEFGEW